MSGNTAKSLLHNPGTNKGTGFTEEERDALHVRGLIPPAVETLDQQVLRVRRQFDALAVPLNRYALLSVIQDTNIHLFYKFLEKNLIDCLPIIYTPTVGDACVEYSHIYKRPQGIYLSPNDRGRVHEILDNWGNEPDIIVVTDGGRILGLGDLGMNGMGIPVGKLSLYVAGAGFDPSRTLPVMLDVGTDNERLLNEPLYLGNRHKRIPEEEYMAFVDEFLMAVKSKWPKCLVQFEDFATPHAIKLLDIYRNRLLCFNDDIQGTGSVILAGFLNALKAQGTKPQDVRCVFYGAGSAAVGVAQTIVTLLETMGLSNEEARRRFWMIDSKGLIVQNRGDDLPEHKIPFARPDEQPMGDLLTVIKTVKPNVLMGLAGSGPAFTKEDVEAMLENCDRPVIFPLSNPTYKSEITAVDAYTWTKGRCIFASGSPFSSVEVDGQTFHPAQGNNMFIFPGVGFGAVVCQAREVTDLMFINAAKRLADLVSPEELQQGAIYPHLNRFREISAEIAAVTVETAFEQGIAGIERPENILELCLSKRWSPDY